MFNALVQFLADFGLYFATSIFVMYLAFNGVFYLIERINMEPIDGVLCKHPCNALQTASERNCLTDKDRLRVVTAILPRELRLAKKLDRSHRMIDLWPMEEFVEFMQMPSYSKAS